MRDSSSPRSPAASSSNDRVRLAGPTVARAIALNALGRHRRRSTRRLPVALSGSEVANEDRREGYVEAGLAALALDDQATSSA